MAMQPVPERKPGPPACKILCPHALSSVSSPNINAELSPTIVKYKPAPQRVAIYQMEHKLLGTKEVKKKGGG